MVKEIIQEESIQIVDFMPVEVCKLSSAGRDRICKESFETSSKVNQYCFKKQSFHIRKVRKRIETLFSQLCDQFMIRRNFAKSFNGLKSRILCKITAFTILQFINKFLTNRNLNNIKYALY